MKLHTASFMHSPCSSNFWFVLSHCAFFCTLKSVVDKQPRVGADYSSFETLYQTVGVLSGDFFGYCKVASVAPWTYLKFYLVLYYTLTQSQDYGAVVGFELGTCLRVVHFCVELLYPKKKAKGLTNWGPLSVNTYDVIPYRLTQLLRNIVAICDELKLDVGIGFVNLGNLWL